MVPELQWSHTPHLLQTHPLSQARWWSRYESRSFWSSRLNRPHDSGKRPPLTRSNWFHRLQSTEERGEQGRKGGRERGEGVTAGSERQINGRRRERGTEEGTGRRDQGEATWRAHSEPGRGDAEEIEDEYQVDGKDRKETR